MDDDDNNSPPASGRVTIALLKQSMEYMSKQMTAIIAVIQERNRLDEERNQLLDKNIHALELRLQHLEDEQELSRNDLSRLAARDIIGTVATAIASIIAGILALHK
jgi:hypothetical protein